MNTAALRRLATPSPDELVERARAMVPEIRVEGGYRLSGTWSFASGCDIAQWGKLGALIAPPGKEPPPGQATQGAFFLVPVEDLEIVDNWFVCGLAGTGSKDIVVKDAFV